MFQHVTSDTDTTDLVAVVSVGLQLLAVFTPSEPELIVQTLIPLPPYHAPSGSVTMTVHAKGYLESLVVIFIMLMKSCLSIITMEKTVHSVSTLFITTTLFKMFKLSSIHQYVIIHSVRLDLLRSRSSHLSPLSSAIPAVPNFSSTHRA